MAICLGSKTDVARFVVEELELLKHGSVSITTISREKSGDYFAITVTEELSAGIGLQLRSSEQPTNTSQEPTQGG